MNLLHATETRPLDWLYPTLPIRPSLVTFIAVSDTSVDTPPIFGTKTETYHYLRVSTEPLYLI